MFMLLNYEMISIFSETPDIRKIFTVILPLIKVLLSGGACGIIVIIIGNGHDDTSSNLGRD